MIDVVWFSFIQGITEFLPVSSSGHLFIFSNLFSLQSVSRSTEVTLNLATLAVTIVFFRTELKNQITGVFKAISGKVSPNFHEALKICVATIPVVCVGFLVHRYLDHLTHSFGLFGLGSILFGILMIVVDKTSLSSKTYSSFSYKDSFLIGCAQTLAFIPGASRLGTSLTMARILGYKSVDAAKFSFLTSIPIGIGAVTLMMKDWAQNSFLQIRFDFFIVSVICFTISFFTLYFFMWWLKKRTLFVWGVYRILLGLFVLYYFNVFF